jgi:hypothetical protein
MMEILDPTTEATPQPIDYKPRPAALAGLRVGLVENTKFNSDRLLQKIGELLRSEYGAADVRMWRKRNASVPAHEEIIEQLRSSCDVMVAGIGD